MPPTRAAASAPAALPPEVRRRRLTLPGSGLEIALLDWGGEGPLALLHHANGFCAAVWGLVAEALRGSFRVMAMDARGHGDSSAPPGPDAYAWDRFAEDLVGVSEALVRELGVPRVALGIGHSFGGTTFVGAASRRPALFGRLALVDPVIRPPGAETEAGRAAGRRLAEGARARRHIFASRAVALRAWRRNAFFRDWAPRALALYVAEGLRDLPDGRVELKCAGEVEAAIFEGGGSVSPFAQAPQVTAPTLLLWARHGSFPRAFYERFAAEMAAARVEDVDCGHLVPMERPDELAERLLAFAQEP